MKTGNDQQVTMAANFRDPGQNQTAAATAAMLIASQMTLAAP